MPSRLAGAFCGKGGQIRRSHSQTRKNSVFAQVSKVSRLWLHGKLGLLNFYFDCLERAKPCVAHTSGLHSLSFWQRGSCQFWAPSRSRAGCWTAICVDAGNSGLSISYGSLVV